MIGRRKNDFCCLFRLHTRDGCGGEAHHVETCAGTNAETSGARDGGTEEVQEGEHGSGGETEDQNLIDVEGLAGEHECYKGDNEAFEGVLEDTGENLADIKGALFLGSVVHRVS
jgi:hypothetical protein